MSTIKSGTVEFSDDISEILARDGLRSVYQPIVDLDRLAPVGVEALARGPAGSAWESPDALFARARSQGKVAAFDSACRRSALAGAVAAGLHGPALLFVNAEPEGLGSRAFPGLDDLPGTLAAAGVQVVLEITERALTHHPAELLRVVEQVRDLGWKLAIDDVGAEPASLALMPFLAPDVIKLDLRLIQARTTVAIAETVNAVLAHAERSGAIVLAEGIETTRHLDLARYMGARLGQGWYFGRPADLRPGVTFAELPIEAIERVKTPATPWSLVRREAGVRTAEKPLLVAMSKTLERQAFASGEACVTLGAFQRYGYFTGETAGRFERLATSAAFVGVLGQGMPAEPVRGVRGRSLSARDPLAWEWDVTVVGPHFAGALLAREHPDRAPGDVRLFDYVVTYDRDRVIAAASSLMHKIAPIVLPD